MEESSGRSRCSYCICNLFCSFELMRISALIFLLMITMEADAQFRNNIWCFGDSAGIDFSNINNPVPFYSSMDGRGTCASISDSLGQLLFYYNTVAGQNGNTGRVWNSLGQIMDNGDSIVGEGWYKEAVIIPSPTHLNLYYIISSGETGSSQIGLYYSLVDISLNGGIGKVVIKNVQLQSIRPCDGLAVIKHGNGRDWWVLFRQWDYNSTIDYDEFYSYLFSQDNISGPFIQQIGSPSNNGFYRIEPSLDGTKICCSEMRDLVEVFDFDRCSGLISNPITVNPRHPDGHYYFSCKLSPDKSKLYVVSDYNDPNLSKFYLYQWDLNAADIPASKDTIATFDAPNAMGILQLAPDGKIYLSSAYESPFTISFPYPDSMRNTTNENLSVINYPDSLGAACDFQPFSFYLGGKRTYYGLPNNPNYELPAWGGSMCDTLGIWNSLNSPSEIKSKLHVFYHPGWQTAFINAEGLKGKNYSMHITDISGKEIFSENGALSSSYFTKDLQCEKFGCGIYFVILETEAERMVKKFAVE